MTTPYKFQEEGIKRMQEFQEAGGGGLNADDMGLGKTFQTLLWAKRYLKKGPIVVVCPATAKWTWQGEASKHLNIRADILEGRTPPRSLPNGSTDHILVINYDILHDPKSSKNWLQWLLRLEPRLLVGDEIHYIQNRTSKRSEAFKQLARIAKHRIALSGTPATNRPAELWPTLNCLRPDLYDSMWSFAVEYCNPEMAYGKWQYKGAKNLEKLHAELTKQIMIRRLKDDVLDQLPPKTRQVILLDLPNYKEYHEASTNFMTWLRRINWNKADSAAKAERLTWMTKMKFLAGKLKVPVVKKWIENFHEATGKKLLTFGIHIEVLEEYHRHFKNSVLVNGSVTGGHRKNRCDEFNSKPKCEDMFGNIDAAGTAWSCTATSHVAKVEFAWVPGKHTQAEDRCRGLGRGTGDPVNVYYLVARNTIEEKFVKILQEKQDNLSKMLDGKVVGDLNVFDLLTQALLKGG